MRKLISVILALCLCILPLALAETSTSEESLTQDFGDFTMDIPMSMQGSIGEKVNNQLYFILYDNYDPNANFNNSLNCVWTDAYTDFSTIDFEGEYAPAVIQLTLETMSTAGVIVENPMLLTTDTADLNGKTAYLMAYSYNADYSQLGMDYQTTLYTLQTYVSDEAMGSYTFTITTNDLNNIETLDALMDSIQWKA